MGWGLSPSDKTKQNKMKHRKWPGNYCFMPGMWRRRALSVCCDFDTSLLKWMRGWIESSPTCRKRNKDRERMDMSPTSPQTSRISPLCFPVSATDWHLPRAFTSHWTTTTRAFAICLCRCSCWPSILPEANSGWRVRHSVLQGNWWNRSFSQFSHSVMFDSLRPDGLQHTRLPCPTPGAWSNSCPSCRWCHLIISSSVIPFSSSLQSFPASGSFPMSQFFTSGGQSIGASASASVLPVNIQDWFPLGLTGWISSKGLSRVFSNITVQKHQFFGTQLALWSNSHIHTWLLEKL